MIICYDSPRKPIKCPSVLKSNTCSHQTPWNQRKWCLRGYLIWDRYGSGMGKTFNKCELSFYCRLLSALPCTSPSTEDSQTVHCRENKPFPKREIHKNMPGQGDADPALSLTKRLCFSNSPLAPYCLQCFFINCCLKLSPSPDPPSVFSAS